MGNVYVVDLGNSRVQKFSASGTFLSQWGSFGTGDGQFYWPYGIACAPDGTILVVDQQNHRIERFGYLATPAVHKTWGWLKDKYRGVQSSE
jgi:DNA-binding beta-propeller fold protein YncE